MGLYNPDRRMIRTTGNIISDMDGDTVMMNVGKGKYYNLGSVGGRIWNLLEHPCTVQQLVDSLTAEYEVTEETCRQQVIQFLSVLSDEGLIEDFEELTNEHTQKA